MEKNNSSPIRIIESIDKNRQISEASILTTLQATQETLTHGDTFTGKPGTQIFSSDNYIVKLHNELTFNERDSERWILKKLDTERELDIYLPDKTWFLYDSNNTPVIANITPLLQPLHQVIHNEADQEVFNHLHQMLNIFFRIAAKHDKLLDGGLSNYGLNSSGELFYLDDDIYKWDKFTAFCNQIGVLIRQLPSIDEKNWKKLGEFCHQTIISYFKDRHQLTIAFEQLRGLFMASEQQKSSLSSFIDGFYQLANKSRSIKKSNNDNYCDTNESNKNIAILADIHANLPALNAVLEDLKRQNIHTGIILGDIVGYGPHPDECIDVIRDTEFTVVKGNHDHAVASGIFAGGFSATGRFVAQWSNEKISNENKHWLDQLQPYIRHDNWLAVHGSPLDKTFFNGYVYKMTFADNLDNLAEREIPICFHGHSHVQGIYYRKGKLDDFSNEANQNLSDYNQSLVCPGSIGQPRTNIPGAEYAVYNTETQDITFHRLDYDMQTTMDDMSAYNFPAQLIERLPLGK